MSVANQQNTIARDVTIDKLGVEVTFIKNEMDSVKNSVSSLSNKLDADLRNIGSEVRLAIAALSAQVTERYKTPWGVIFAGLTVLFILLGFIGHQALDPIQASIGQLQASLLATQTVVVPRQEHALRAELNSIRMETIERAVKMVEERRYDELQKQVEYLRGDRDYFKHKAWGDRPGEEPRDKH